jgi:hypothetical protein
VSGLTTMPQSTAQTMRWTLSEPLDLGHLGEVATEGELNRDAAAPPWR